MTDTSAKTAPRPSLRQRLNDSDLWLSFKASPVTIVAAVTTILIFLLAFLADFVAPQDAFDPAALNLMDGFTHPMERGAGSNMLFLMGSDAQGRDMLSALFYGTRVSLIVGFCSVGFSMVLGISLGLIAGYVGGRTELLIMRIADIQLSFPAILIALLVFGVARGLIPPNKHETTALIRHHLRDRPLALGAIRPHRPRLGDGGAEQGLRACGQADRHPRPSDHGEAHPAQRDEPGAGDRHHQPCAGRD